MRTTNNEQIFFTLASATRCQILEILQTRGGQRTVELSRKFTITRQAVLKHLQVLENAELVTVQRSRGETTFYVNQQVLCACSNWLTQFTDDGRSIVVDDKRADATQRDES